MTAPDPQSSNVIQNHIAKRAPSRHDITLPIGFDVIRKSLYQAAQPVAIGGERNLNVSHGR
jgi:hypothetical protein